jgi:putative hemolysin
VSAVLSGFFALAGYSLRGFRRSQLEHAIGTGGKGLADRIESQLMALRLTTAFCRLAASVSLVVSLVYLFDAQRGNWQDLLKAMILACFILAIFTEAIPQAWAYYSGHKVLAVTGGVLLALRYALYPVAMLMQAMDTPIRRLSGAPEQDTGEQIVKQEIMQAASEGKAEGIVNADEVRMIESVMEFGHLRAGEIMTPRTDIVALRASTPWQDACKMIHTAGHTRVPLYDGDLDNIIGVVYAKDLLEYVGSDKPMELRSMMHKPFFVPQTKRLDDLLREFKARKVHLAIVLDEYGGTAGLVSFEDVLEEIVGDISDEYDRPEPALMKRLDDKAAEVDGRMYIDDLNKAMRLQIPEDADYDTAAGLVFSELGYIPTAGETLEAYGARFTILAADERRITRMKVELRPQERAE